VNRVVLGGVLLAAGASQRMGRPKAFLEVSGTTFLQRAVAILASGECSRVVVVCPPSESAHFATFVDTSTCSAIENPEPQRGMLSSLALGLAALPDHVTHAMVTLVDTPLISQETAQLLAGECRQHPDSILVPHAGGIPGHPVVYPRAHWEPLVGWVGPGGARGYLSKVAHLVRAIEVADEGILRDFDSPEDLRSMGPL